MVPWVPQSPGYGSGPGAPQGSLLQAPGTVGPSTLQGVTLDAYGAFTPTRALRLWGSVTLWSRWGVWSQRYRNQGSRQVTSPRPPAAL